MPAQGQIGKSKNGHKTLFRGKRVIRVFVLFFTIMNSPKALSYNELLRRLEEGGLPICKRTLQRDLMALEAAGLPIEKKTHPDGSVRWSKAGSPSSLLSLSFPMEHSEMLVLALARRALALTDMAWLGEDFDKLFNRLFGANSRLRSLYEQLVDRSCAQKIDTRKPTFCAGFLDVLVNAIEGRKKIQLTYCDHKQKKSTRVVCPSLLFVDDHSRIYLRAYCETRKEYRNFRLSRMLKVEQLKETFPEKLVVDAGKDIEHSLGAFVTQPQRIVLEVDEMLADYLEENPIHHSQTVHHSSRPKRVELVLGINETLIHQLMGFGAHVRVLEPTSLAQELVDRHRAAIDAQLLAKEGSDDQLTLPLAFEE